MSTQVSSANTVFSSHSATASNVASKHKQIFAAAILGFIIVTAVGLLPMDVVHNAAHDTRHSAAFPCH